MRNDQSSNKTRDLEEAVMARLWLIGIGDIHDKMPASVKQNMLQMAHNYAEHSCVSGKSEHPAMFPGH